MRVSFILVVEDERHLAAFLKAELEASGYRVRATESGPSALRLLEAGGYDLVLLDIMLPGMDGFEVLRRLRENSAVPVIVLTAKGDEADRVRGLNLGADDYLPKPFSTLELLARVKAVLRRARLPETSEVGPPFVCGDLAVDFARRQVMVRGQEVRLSRTEYRLLSELARHCGQVLLHEDLLTRVWGRSYRRETEYLWVYIGYLREKIERNPRQPEYILTRPGVGYMLRGPGGDETAVASTTAGS